MPQVLSQTPLYLVRIQTSGRIFAGLHPGWKAVPFSHVRVTVCITCKFSQWETCYQRPSIYSAHGWNSMVAPGLISAARALRFPTSVSGDQDSFLESVKFLELWLVSSQEYRPVPFSYWFTSCFHLLNLMFHFAFVYISWRNLKRILSRKHSLKWKKTCHSSIIFFHTMLIILNISYRW